MAPYEWAFSCPSKNTFYRINNKNKNINKEVVVSYAGQQNKFIQTKENVQFKRYINVQNSFLIEEQYNNIKKTKEA